MSEANKKRRKRQPRQFWEPSGAMKLVGSVWKLAISAAKVAVGALATVLMILLVCAFVFIGILGDYLQNDIIPNSDYTLEGYDQNENSNMYAVDADGNIVLLQKLHAATKSGWIAYEDIPQNLIDATVAIEDKRFFEHQGVDWITTVKACLGMFFGTSDAGGSSITQQLIKNLTTEDSITVQRKVMEIFRAITFEKRYAKEVVLEWYLNKIYLGNNCEGVKAAAEKYFGKEVQSLTIAECASLISITNNPSIYNPYSEKEYEWPKGSGEIRNGYERNEYRKELVIEQMLQQELITQEEYDEAMAQELVLKDGIDAQDRWVKCEHEGCGYGGTVATYWLYENRYYCPNCFGEIEVLVDASTVVYSYFVDTVLEDVAQDLCERDGMEWNEDTKALYKDLLSRSGYHIYTTLDMTVQAQVDAIYKNLDEIPEAKSGQQLQSAIVVINNETGDIVAMAGGVGDDKVHDGLNRATDSELQSGSSIKPLSVYAPAFELGLITPATVISDMPYMYNENEDDPDDPIGWPRNDNNIYQYNRTVFQGIVSSVNAIAVNTLDALGTQYSFEFATEKFGISTLIEQMVTSSGTILSDIGLSPLALGAQTEGVNVRDMTAAFATFANEGVYRDARTYTKIYDRDGNLVLDNTQESEKIISEKTVNYMNYCLDNAVQSGTGRHADLLNGKMATAGKTGTTQSGKDRWFCGFTGYYTAAVWVGYDIPEVINLVGDTSNPASRLWKKVMEPLHEGLESIPLYDADKLVNVTICLDSGKLATDACRHDVRGESRLYTTKVYEEDLPTTICDKHIDVEYCTGGNGAATDYCKLFHLVGEATVADQGLVKLTQTEVNEILKAEKTGLQAKYLDDSYVYLVDKAGNGLNFKGFHGDANTEFLEPCIMCTEHTEEAWEAYILEHPEAAHLKVSDFYYQ